MRVDGTDSGPDSIGTSGTATGTSSIGVLGKGDGAGVRGESTAGVGVFGRSTSSSGIGGRSDSGIGVHGISQSEAGIQGNSPSGRGVAGFSDNWQGVYGFSKTNAGVVGESAEFDGVFGRSNTATAAGVSGHNTAGGLAGFFDGNVEVTGDVILKNADCAEDFDVAESDATEPGTVMVLDDDGALRPSEIPYDRRVAGVVSGAGGYKPGIILDKRATDSRRMPIALLGKVFCKVDASYGAIGVGDLLTTSPTLGHAMRADDPQQAFGAVIGKALRPLNEGQSLLPILIALQ